MIGRRAHALLRDQQRRANRVLRFFGNGIDVHTVQWSEPTACGGLEWRVAFELARPARTGGLIVQQVDESRVLGGCDRRARDRRRIAPYWVAWEVARGRRTTGNAYDDLYAEPSHPHSKGRIDVLGTVRFYEGAELPAGMVPHSPNTPAGAQPSTTARPPFVTAAGASHHDLRASWDCCADPPRAVAARPVPPATATAPPPAGEPEGLLAGVPPWTDGRYDARKTASLVASAAAARELVNFRLRAEIRTFAAAHGDSVREMSRVFLLLRVVFELPRWIPRHDAQVFGGWNHPSHFRPGQASFRVGWPVVTSDDGRITVPGAYRSYRGRPYDAAAEFDYFAARFPRRA